MKLTERVSYLRGLIDGMEIKDSKQGKVIAMIADILGDMAEEIEDIQDQVDEVVDVVDAIDEDLGEVEKDFYDFDEDDCCCGDDDYDDDDDFDFDDDDELYEVVCPTCGDSIMLNEQMVEEGSMNCPNCGELLEFDLEEEDEEGSDEE